MFASWQVAYTVISPSLNLKVKRMLLFLHDMSQMRLLKSMHASHVQGESRDYYRASNSLLPCVLIDKRGIPISLAIVHAAVGRRAGLPIDCIGMPMHLINRMLLPGSDEERFIDVFRGGQLLTRYTGWPKERCAIQFSAQWQRMCWQPLL